MYTFFAHLFDILLASHEIRYVVTKCCYPRFLSLLFLPKCHKQSGYNKLNPYQFHYIFLFIDFQSGVCSAVMDKGERERKPESESKSNFSLEFLHHLCQYLFIGCPIDFNFLVECKRPNAKFFAKQHQLERYTSSNTWSAFCFDTTQTQFGFVLHCTFSYLPYTFIIRIYLSLDPSFRSFHDSAAVVIERINIAAEKMKNNFHHV